MAYVQLPQSHGLHNLHRSPFLPLTHRLACSKRSSSRVLRSFEARIFSISASSSAVANPIQQAESDLIDALVGIQGRGRGVSSTKLENISDAVKSLEAIVGIDEPTSSSLIEGTWRLMFTTRPGTASPIQRAFVGVDTFSVFQEITLRGTDDPRVCNIVRFSEAIGELKVEVIEELVPTNPIKNSADLEHLAGKWRLVWSSQAADANWLQKATTGFPSWQIVKAESGRLENLVEFFPGLRLRARARSEASSTQRRDVNIEGATLEVGSVELPLKITGSGFTEVRYLDKKIRITRGNKGSTFVHVRDE